MNAQHPIMIGYMKSTSLDKYIPDVGPAINYIIEAAENNESSLSLHFDHEESIHVVEDIVRGAGFPQAYFDYRTGTFYLDKEKAEEQAITAGKKAEDLKTITKKAYLSRLTTILDKCMESAKDGFSKCRVEFAKRFAEDITKALTELGYTVELIQKGSERGKYFLIDDVYEISW